MPGHLYTPQDADLTWLVGKAVTIAGYGQMGRAIALNLRDLGLNVRIGNRPDDDYAQQARRDGFGVAPIAEAVKGADVIFLLLPDEAMPTIYLDSVAPALRQDETLVFASGYAVAFGYIEPPSFVDVVLVAPKMAGKGVRERVADGRGFVSFVGVWQDASGQAWDRVLAIASACGALRAGAVEMTFEQEAELDLFAAQALHAGILRLIHILGQILVDYGYPTDAILAELYLSGELGYLLQEAARHGMGHMLDLIPPMNAYGLLANMDTFFDELKLRRRFEQVLEDIRSGTFAERWGREYFDDYAQLRDARERLQKAPITQLERGTLDLFAMLDARRETEADD